MTKEDYFEQAVNAFGDDNLDEAIHMYRKALEVDSGYQDALHGLGMALFNRGLVDEAIGTAKRLIEIDPDDILAADDSNPASPEDWLSRKQIAEKIDAALENLPLRQRQAFLLRYWEGMDVADTAAAMGCSQGSVKTHCSRATPALAAWLSRHGVTL